MKLSYEQILEEIVNVISSKVGTSISINTESHILRDLGLDSLQLMELVALLEDRFQVVLPLEELPSFETIEQVARYVHQQNAL